MPSPGPATRQEHREIARASNASPKQSPPAPYRNDMRARICRRANSDPTSRDDRNKCAVRARPRATASRQRNPLDCNELLTACRARSSAAPAPPSAPSDKGPNPRTCAGASWRAVRLREHRTPAIPLVALQAKSQNHRQAHEAAIAPAFRPRSRPLQATRMVSHSDRELMVR